MTDRIAPAMNALLSDMGEALAYDPPRLVSLAPGASVAWDNTCGQAYVRVIRIEPKETRGNCGLELLRVRIAFGVLRCVAVLADDGTPPTSEAMTADTEKIMKDADAVMNAFLQNSMPKVQRKELVEWLPQGPRGGVAGGEWISLLTFLGCS